MDKVNLTGLTVVGFYGNAKTVAGVIENVGTMPLASIGEFQKKVNSIGASKNDTVCLDFTCGNDAQLVTTMIRTLHRK